MPNVRVETLPCIYCGETSIIELDEEKYEKYMEGESKIEDIWPEKSPDEREMIMTGTHPKCWDKIFEGMEEE